MNCDNCENYRNVGPTIVPYGDTWVSAGNDWECGKGLDPDDCDPDDRHHTIRSYSHGFTEQELEAGDYFGDLDRDEGRRR